MRRLVLLTALLLGPPLHAEDPPEQDPLAAPIRAVLLEDDAGLRKVYDGIRKGLELAQLQRVALESVEDTPEAFAAYAKRVESDPPPLLFAIGRRAAERILRTPIRSPRVFVDACVRVGTEEHPAAPAPDGPAAVVRGVTPAARWGEVIRAMFRTRATDAPLFAVRAAWSAWPPEAWSVLARFTREIGADEGDDHVTEDGEDAFEPTVTLHWRAGLGETLAPWPPEDRLRLSDDVAHWGKGAVVVLAPDHLLLGRTAAEAGRQLLREPPEGVLRMSVEVTEVRVDLDAAKAAGLDLPVSFVASADVLRGGKR